MCIVHGRVQAIGYGLVRAAYTAMYRVHGHVHGRLHGPCPWPYTRPSRPCTWPAATYVYGSCARPVCTRPVYTAVCVYDPYIRPCTWPCTRPCTRTVHGRVHGPYTAVYTDRTRPCTRTVHGRVHGPYTAVYVPWTRPCTGYGPCTRPCTWSHGHVHGRLLVYTAMDTAHVHSHIHGLYRPCTLNNNLTTKQQVDCHRKEK